MDLIMTPIKEIAGMKFRQLLTQIIVLGTVVSSALMMWKGLMLITHSESPIVVTGYLPYIGILTILLNDYPYLKWGVLLIMGIMVLTSKDPQDT
jgi:hypothetical protein